MFCSCLPPVVGMDYFLNLTRATIREGDLFCATVQHMYIVVNSDQKMHFLFTTVLHFFCRKYFKCFSTIPFMTRLFRLSEHPPGMLVTRHSIVPSDTHVRLLWLDSRYGDSQGNRLPSWILSSEAILSKAAGPRDGCHCSRVSH